MLWKMCRGDEEKRESFGSFSQPPDEFFDFRGGSARILNLEIKTLSGSRN